MKVEREDIYEFKLTLTEAEFNTIKRFADEVRMSIECILLRLIRVSFNELEKE